MGNVQNIPIIESNIGPDWIKFDKTCKYQVKNKNPNAFGHRDSIILLVGPLGY